MQMDHQEEQKGPSLIHVPGSWSPAWWILMEPCWCAGRVILWDPDVLRAEILRALTSVEELSVLPSNFASNTFNMFVSNRRKVSHFPGGHNSALGCKNYGVLICSRRQSPLSGHNLQECWADLFSKNWMECVEEWKIRRKVKLKAHNR